jgi:hypothetical protein
MLVFLNVTIDQPLIKAFMSVENHFAIALGTASENI